MKKIPYKTSKDYNQLFKLAISGYRIVCLIDEKIQLGKNQTVTIQTIAECSGKQEPHWAIEDKDFVEISVYVTGHGFFEANRKKDFVSKCSKNGISFLVPTELTTNEDDSLL